MHDVTLVGDWALVATAQIDAEADFIGEDTDPASISAWLNGSGEALVEDATPVSGLALTVRSDGTFDERVTGAPAIAWFDVEGVLVEQATPFVGTMTLLGGTGYLRPLEVASWAIPVEGRHGAAVLRYDDGDTKIADGIRSVDGQLLRTVNVVTDELYLTRILLIYARSDG